MVAIDRRRAAGALTLLGLLLLAGCVQIGVHSTVAADGTIEEYRMNVNVSRTAYGLIEASAEEEGYDSVEAYVLADVEGEARADADAAGGSFLGGVNASNAGSITYDESFEGDRVSMQITIEDFAVPADGPISITQEDGQLVYEDLTFVNESAANASEPESEFAQQATAGFAVDYYLTMPGEITDTNADEVDGNTAEWHATGGDAFTDTRIYATSETPTSVPLDGFGVGIAFASILVAIGLVALRRR